MALIIKQRLLRTGDLEFSATTANDVDQYLVIVNERLNKGEVAELFIAYAGNPVPRATLKTLGSGVMICDRIKCSSGGPNQGYIWNVEVYWKELESDQPNQQSRPTPNSSSVDPEDWTPTWQRRTVIVHEPAERAKYLGGYALSGTFTTWFVDNEDTDGKAPLVNSALQPLVETKEHRRRLYIWTLRWLRPSVPASLVEAEGMLNDTDFTITIGGYAFAWERRTALIDSVNLSKMKWGNQTLSEITVEVAHDPEGWEWSLQDKGTAQRFGPGDTGFSGTILPAGQPLQKALKDANGKAIQDPVLLNGDGQPAGPGVPAVYGRWLDFEEVNFNSVYLIRDLGS